MTSDSARTKSVPPSFRLWTRSLVQLVDPSDQPAIVGSCSTDASKMLRLLPTNSATVYPCISATAGFA